MLLISTNIENTFHSMVPQLASICIVNAATTGHAPRGASATNPTPRDNYLTAYFFFLSLQSIIKQRRALVQAYGLLLAPN